MSFAWLRLWFAPVVSSYGKAKEKMNEYIVLLDPENEQSATLIESLAVASEEYRRIFINAVAIYSDKNIVEIREWLFSVIGRPEEYLVCESKNVIAEGNV